MARKLFNYYTLGLLFKSLYESCMKAEEQERNGEKVTACGMSDEDIDRLCEDILPNMLNPMMSTEEVKEKLHVSDATLNRMVARGDIPNGEHKKRGHTRYWKKWLTRQSPWRSLTKTPTIFNGLSFKFATFATWNIKQT